MLVYSQSNCKILKVIDIEQSFFGVQYLYEMDAIIGGSISDNQIKFYNQHSF